MCRIWSLHKASVDNHILSTDIVADDVIVIVILARETKTSDNIVISLSAYNSCPIYNYRQYRTAKIYYHCIAIPNSCPKLGPKTTFISDGKIDFIICSILYYNIFKNKTFRKRSPIRL